LSDNKWIRYWQFPWQLTPSDTYEIGNNSWIIIDLFCNPLEFQPNMMKWIVRHSTGFLNYTSALTNNVHSFLGLQKRSLNPLSKLLTSFQSAIKTGLQSYCDSSYSRGGVNQMWILKNSKDLLEYIKLRYISSCNIIKTFEFSTLYTAMPHYMLKDRLKEYVQLCFI
jgi:hypothetical protein